jgi:1-acyl-sn-glycerol-3-phosphate acyltransferase
MPEFPLLRRMLTVPSVVVGFGLLTALAPALIPVAAMVDLARRTTSGRPAMALRSLAFLWVYLLGELWALTTLAVTAPLPPRQRAELTYRLQDKWAGWNLVAMRRLFSVEFEVSGGAAVLPGPIVLLSRHASIVDTLLPAHFVARPTGLRLRYVLKKELLVDPALDIAGNRLPNVFVDRAARDLAERAAIETLAASMGPGDGLLIYPEGTRFSPEKLSRVQRRSSAEHESASIVAGLRRVLPPKPGGTLAILDATDADIVVFAHRGLEGLATLKEIWQGNLVGSRVEVAMWRIPHDQIPATRPERTAWLYQLWAEVDAWVVTGPAGGEAE